MIKRILFFLILLVFHQPAEGKTAVSSLLTLPADRSAYKITLDEDGTYALTYDALKNAGMLVDTVNPHHFMLMYRGEAAAYALDGNSNNTFEPGESIQFYGWAFDGSRYEKQFVSDNVFWLWVGDTPGNEIALETLPLHQQDRPTSPTKTITIEPENDFFSTWTDRWDTFPNEPDAWYWDRIPRVGIGSPSSPLTYTIPLDNPDINSGETALFTAEFTSRAKAAVPNHIPYQVSLSFNNYDPLSQAWQGRQNVNISGPLPASILRHGDNVVTAVISTTDVLYLNRMTVTYPQKLTAVPTLLAADENIKHPTVRQIDPVNLWPSQGGATWLAITHPRLRPAANRLAAYRRTFSNLSTHVVSSEAIINQYGYGLPLPTAIQDYLKEASEQWSISPDYVVLFGDATLNPRQLACKWSCEGVGWDADAPTLIPTDLQFVDRFQGLIPTDHTFSLLNGNDLIADIAVGRLSARTVTEAQTIVDKIIQYEQNQEDPALWQQKILFVADSEDAAGAFCTHNHLTGQKLPPAHQQHLCLPSQPTAADVADLQTKMYQTLNNTGAWILNYRGHGSIQNWGSSPPILSVADGSSAVGSWRNEQPTVILSADCLDGHFAWPGVEAISETLLRLPHAGTAAHWSSTGLGLDTEHTLLHNGFYAGLQQTGTMRIGDAVLYAKEVYAQSQHHASPLYSFTLQGDPAMKLSWIAHDVSFLPMLIKP